MGFMMFRFLRKLFQKTNKAPVKGLKSEFDDFKPNCSKFVTYKPNGRPISVISKSYPGIEPVFDNKPYHRRIEITELKNR